MSETDSSERTNRRQLIIASPACSSNRINVRGASRATAAAAALSRFRTASLTLSTANSLVHNDYDDDDDIAVIDFKPSSAPPDVVVLSQEIEILSRNTPEILVVKPSIEVLSREIQFLSPSRRLRPEKKQVCTVCTDEKAFPIDFYRLSKCQHAFCRDCLHQSTAIKVKEGDIKTISCLSLECKASIAFNDIKALLTWNEFRRYDKLLVEQQLAACEDVSICPNKECGMQFVNFDAAHQRFQTAQCPHCSQTICIKCKQLRKIAPGAVQHSCEPYLQQVMDEYEAAPNGSAARIRLESVYGREKLQNMIDNRRSEREVELNKKKCPQCRAPSEKISGCNKVICKCGCAWCWLCGTIVVGYGHFEQRVCPLR